MSQILRQSTERIVRIGSFVDKTDGVTPETGVTLGAADQAEAMKAGGGASVDIAAATWAAVTGSDGWYDLTLSTSVTDTVGDLVIVVQDADVCLPVLARFTVVEEAVYDALYAASAPGYGTAQSGDTYALAAGATGFAAIDTVVDAILVDTGTTLPATLSTIAGYLDTEIAAILADTNELQTDWADGGRLDLLLDGAASAGDPWTTALPGAYGAGTAGYIVGNQILGYVDCLPATWVTVPTAVQVRTEIDSNSTQLAAIVADTSELQTNQGNWVTADVSGLATAANLATVAGYLDTEIATLIGYGAPPAASAIADAVWDELSTGHTDAGKAGAQVWTDIDAILDDTDLIDDATSGLAKIATDVAAILVDTNELQTDWTNDGRLDVILDAASAPSAAAVADAVWDEVLSGHAGVGSAGAALSAAGSAGDPWSTPLPGAYADGTAGYIIGGFSGSAGSGADSVTITWNDGAGNPVPDGDVWITSDSAGTTVVAGTLQTDSNGQATFLLDEDSVYYFFAQKDGMNSIKGRQFTAVAD